MSQKTTDLRTKIQRLKKEDERPQAHSSTQGYSISVVMLTDLLSCILVGLGVGLFFQKFFHTPVLLTAALTLLGGIAGLWNVVRFAMNQDKGNKK